jgi:hypothetical protein
MTAIGARQDSRSLRGTTLRTPREGQRCGVLIMGSLRADVFVATEVLISAPAYRFYLLYDKVYRADILAHAYALSKQHGGAPGVDGVTFDDIEAAGRERWLAAVQEALRTETYRPQPVRRVLIPKPGGTGERPLGIPVIRDRVVQTAALLILQPIFGATRQGWSGRSQGGDDLAKPRMSSCGCETRLTWVSPLGSVASLAPAAVTPPAKRRHASVWAVGMQPRKGHSGCRGRRRARRLQGPLREGARGGRTRRGVRPRHARRGRPRHLGGPRFSSDGPGAAETR